MASISIYTIFMYLWQISNLLKFKWTLCTHGVIRSVEFFFSFNFIHRHPKETESRSISIEFTMYCCIDMHYAYNEMWFFLWISNSNEWMNNIIIHFIISLWVLGADSCICCMHPICSWKFSPNFNDVAENTIP